MTIQLEHEWSVGALIDTGGFGRVYAASSAAFDGDFVATFIPKVPEAERELLFVDLGEARNVVRVIDSGEHGDDYVLVMPRAEKSLRQHISERGQPSADEAVAVLSDVATALEDLDGRVVHRDLKPESVLFLDGRRSLADFGTSRYAESTTAPDTRKYAVTPALRSAGAVALGTGYGSNRHLGARRHGVRDARRDAPFSGPGRAVSAAPSSRCASPRSERFCLTCSPRGLVFAEAAGDAAHCDRGRASAKSHCRVSSSP
jgi:serine/threonine protein kinase